MPRLLPVLLLIACGGDPGPDADATADLPGPCVPGPDPSLQIGSGEVSFNAFDPDAPSIELIHGPQGGYHVLIALQATHIDAPDLIAGSVSGSIDGVELAHSAPWLSFRCNATTNALESAGTLLIWDSTPEELDGAEATITVELTDASDTVLTASTSLTIDDPTL